MPSEMGPYYEDNSARIKAWTEHYIRKGCHPVKARDVAYKKVWSSRMWPA